MTRHRAELMDTEITQPIPVIPATLAYSATGPAGRGWDAPTDRHGAVPQPENGTADAADADDEQPQGLWHWVLQFVTWVLLLAALATLTVVIIIPKVTGAQSYTVLTSSMRPDYPPGTLIVVRKRSADSIKVGDVVTYQIKSGEPDVITHRVQSISIDQEGNPVFVTKGDNNRVADPKPVKAAQVRGTLWYAIPYLGYVNNWIGGSAKSILVMVVAGLLFAYALWEIVGGFRDDKRKKADESAEAAKS